MAVGFQQILPTLAVTISAAASVNTALGQRVNGITLRIVNGDATHPIFIRAGIGSQTAAATDTPVPPGNAGFPVDIYVGPADNVAVFAPSGAAGTVYICPGN